MVMFLMQKPLRFLLIILTAALSSTALACSATPADLSPSSSDFRWNVTINDTTPNLSESCLQALQIAMYRLSVESSLQLEIVPHGDGFGSISLELAQLSRLADKFKTAIEQKSNKTRLKIETQLLPKLGNEGKAQTIGKVLLRLVKISP